MAAVMAPTTLVSWKPVPVAGIMLETTNLSQVLEALAMGQCELGKLMAPSPSWPFPGSLDGWKLSHDAVRYDMEAILAGIEKTKSMVDNGRTLSWWQVQAFQLIVHEFHRNVQQHHDHEEEIFFPWMATRVTLPPKMSSDHRVLMTLMDRVRDLCDQLEPADKAAKSRLRDLRTTFVQLRVLMRQHLEEEEIIGLPLLRKHFTAKEAAVVEKKIVAGMKPSDMAWFLRPMDMAQKKETMTRMQILGVIQKFVLLPAVRKDERTVLRAYRELAAGARSQQLNQKKARVFCFVA